jgi:hypothetical protein
LIAFAKYLVDEGQSHSISEHELFQLAQAEAQKTRKANETPAQAFSRYYQSDEALPVRKAIAICKGYPQVMSIEPTSVEVGSSATEDDSKAAYDKLTEMAEAQREKAPWLSAAQCFARVFEQNPELAAKAHRRPQASASNSYPFPSR